jgi:glycosyltransferase involved in cell wall biosynthesis
MYDVSVIILCYNRLDYTKKCYDSLIKNCPEKTEVVFVDNGSTDGTRDWLKLFEKEKDVKVVLNESNLMPAGGNRVGLQKASKAKYYLLCDNDGYFENPDWYKVGFMFMDNIANLGVFCLRKSRWNPIIDSKELVLNDYSYYLTEKVASFSLISPEVADILKQKLKGKWIGHVIAELAEKIGYVSGRHKYGYITDQSDDDLDNPNYRDQYIKIWGEKRRLKEFERRISILNEEQNKSEKNLFSLIIPTMWKQMKYLRKMLPVYNDEKLIGEILIVNNAKNRFDLNKIKSFSKVRIINDGNNLYVNPSWNFGVQAAKYDKVIIANDDIYFEGLGKVLELVDAKLSKNKIFGFAENCFYQKQKLSLHLREPEEGYKAHGFGMFMIMEKDSYHEIPNEIKIWCGDRLLYYMNEPLLIEGVDVDAEIGGTTRSLKLGKYRISDNAYWRDLKKKLKKQKPKLPETNVVLVYKTGGDFELKDVHLLVDQLHKKKRNLNLKVYCLTDCVSKEMDLGNFTLLPMVGKWKGWWSKMNLFSSKYAYLRPFLYMDLDTAVISYLENTVPKEQYKDSFIALRDFYRSKKAASGLMWFPVNGGLPDKVWDVWKENPEHFMGVYRGDQDFIFSIIKPDKYWQDITAGIVSSKPKKQFLNELKGLEDIVCFHGKPRIFDAARQYKWVNAYVQRKL